MCTVIARDIFADAASNAASYATKAAEKASKAAEKSRPSEDELSNVEEAADVFPSREEGEAAADRVKAEKQRLPSGAEMKKQAMDKSRGFAEETRRRTHQAGDDIQEYLKQKFPKQRRDAVINRFKKVLADIQNNPDFQETAEFIIQLIGDYAERLKDVAVEEGKRIKSDTSLHYDEHFEEAMQNGKVCV